MKTMNLFEEYEEKTDKEVIDFINQFLQHQHTEESMEIIRYQFRAGYCYHFAIILKNVFKRGEVCWAAPYGHFVWLDDNGVPYDVEGVYGGETFCFIPENYLGDKQILDFLHIPGRVYGTPKEEIIQTIRRYCKDNSIEYDPSVEEWLL